MTLSIETIAAKKCIGGVMSRPWRLRALMVAGFVAFSVGQCPAQSANSQTLRPEVQKRLKATQEAFAAQKTEQALEITNEVLKVPQLTPFERVTALRMRAAVANALQNWELTAASLEEVLGHTELNGQEKWSMLEVLINAAQNKKDWQQVKRWSRVYTDEKGPKAAIHSVLIQALYAQGEFRQVVDEIQKKTNSGDPLQRKSSEVDLQRLAMAHQKLKDASAYAKTMKQLLAQYPSKAYWKEVIASIASQPEFNDRLILDLFRLLEEADAMDDASSFIEMANHALKASLALEAQRVVNNGFVLGVLGNGDAALVHQQLRRDIEAKVKQDAQLTTQLEKGALNANQWLSLGQVFVSMQKWDAATDALSKAEAMGGIRRENELWLNSAVALFKSGQKEQALLKLDKVHGDATASDIADLWRLKMKQR